ncbi:MAG TPA: helix-hairpin-helix domain-containing protein [Tepidisphaeraceae bacterium]|jgi:hypothetical protein
MVIAVLVLMALIGTAYVSVARIDRQAAATGSSNTQQNLLAAQVAQQAETLILNGVFAQTTAGAYYRPVVDNSNNAISVQDTNGNTLYHDYDSPFDDHEGWLASRIPQPLDVTAPVTEAITATSAGYTSPTVMYGAIGGGTTPNPVVWPAVTLLENTSLTTSTTSTYSVDAPLNITSNAGTQQTIALGGLGVGNKRQYRFAPTYATITSAGTTTTYPAMAIYKLPVTIPPTLSPLAYVATVLAADADGDGIADSLYYKLTNQPTPGVTYYAAVRIVDNNSAINATTAWSLTNDFDGDSTNHYATQNLGFFASNVGLQELLRSYVAPSYSAGVLATPPDSTEMDALTAFRFNWTTANSFTGGGWPQLDAAAYPAGGRPYPDPTYNSWSPGVGNYRTDYGYITYGDMLQMNLARRPENPGETYIQSSSSGLLHFQPLSWADSAALAYRFCIPQSSTGSSTVETKLSLSLLDGVGTTTSGNPSSSYPIGPSTKTIATGGSPGPYQANGILPSTGPNTYGYTASASVKDGAWYNDNFDFDQVATLNSATGTPSPIAANASTCRPLRAITVARNPVSDNVPWDTSVLWNPDATINGAQYTTKTVGAVSTTTPNKPPCRANLNTSGFTDLYNAFLAVMNRCDYLTSNPFQNITSTAVTLQGVNTTTNKLNNTDVQELRAGLAAANTMSMRVTGYAGASLVTGTSTYSQTVNLSATGDKAYVYGITPQPFLVGAVMNDISDGQTAYVAIELFNPTSAPMDLTGSKWQLASWDGSATLTTLFTFDTSATFNNNGGGTAHAIIPAAGVIWIASSNSPPTASASASAGGAPTPLNASSSNITVYATNLANAAHKMIVLVRPVAGQAIDLTKPTTFAPVDQVDLSTVPAVPTMTARFYVYGRTPTAWQCVYPSKTTTAPVPPANNDSTTATPPWNVVTAPLDQDNNASGDITSSTTLSAYNGQVAIANSAIGAAGAYTTFNIPLGFDKLSYPGPNTVVAPGSNGNKFPFGGFARDGDAFKIPFIGSYIVTDAGTTKILMINGISFDSASAEDNNGGDDGQERIGQFCPLGDPSSAVASTQLDYDPTPGSTNHRYYFARFLLDYVGAVNTPDSDESPNADPETAGANPISYFAKTGIQPQDVANNASLHSYVTGDTNTNTNWANHNITPSNYNNEYDQPNEGLVNINTAPWPVLAMLPMVTYGGVKGEIDQANNTLLAKAIVSYRDKYGPFTSVFDLNRVFDPASAGAWSLTTKGFINEWNTLTMGGGGEPDQNYCDFTNIAGGVTITRPTATPAPPLTIEQDEAKNYLTALTRISNLITTRSDSFTVYIVVEGWQNAGTANATRVSQVRQAYIVDRSHVSNLNKTLNIIPVPTN